MERSQRHDEDDDVTASAAVQAQTKAGAGAEADHDDGRDDGDAPVVQAKGDAGGAGSWDADDGLMSAMGLGGEVQMLEAEAPMEFDAAQPGTQVQLRGPRRMRPKAQQIQEAAAEGVAGTGGQLPHLGAIQESFGKHDVSGVKAHTGSAAAAATERMGAEAYATNASGQGDVAFSSSSPTLHTAAHEAAHVVQQRGGVQLKGGVGEAGDTYEQHADAVADAVVRGESAEALLDPHAGGATSSEPVQRSAIQKKDVSTFFGTFKTTKFSKFGTTGVD